MAFSADELRVLRRALAQALQPSSPTGNTPEEVQDLLRLADAVEEAAREGGRLGTFLSAELVRYRTALPGAAAGYLERLRGALESGYIPQPDDLAALRRLRAQSRTPAEESRRTTMLRRCEHLAELDVRARLGRLVPAPAGPVAPRPRLLALPGGRSAADRETVRTADGTGGTGDSNGNGVHGADCANGAQEPEHREQEKKEERKEQRERRQREPKPEREQQRKREPQREREQHKGRGTDPATAPGRRVPTPAEVWPPRRRPAPPAGEPREPREPRKPAPPPEQRRGA